MVSKELLEKAKKCSSKEELLELAKSENVEVSEAEINAILATTGTSGELSDEELENVTGGTCFSTGVTDPKTGEYKEYAIVSPLNLCPLNSLKVNGFNTVCQDCDSSFIDGATWYCRKRWSGHNTAVVQDGFIIFVDD